MNILQILPQLNAGGVETGTVDLARILVREGHGCVVVSAGGGLVRELEKMGVRHYTLAVDSKAFWVMMREAGKLAKIIKEEKIDIVHARSRVPAWVAFFALRKTSFILVTTAHGHYRRHIFSAIMGSGKVTIVPSSVIGRHMMEEFGVLRENIRLIPRSVDLVRFAFRGLQRKPPPEPFLIGMIGRITPVKGQVYFLKALAKALRDVPSLRGWIVGGVSPGKGAYMEELKLLTRRLGLTEKVEFLGNRRDIPEILSKLRVLVMASTIEEAFGRVIVEAQASGVPVVATKVGGVCEIIEDGKDGLLVSPKDHEALAEAMVRILKDPSLAEALVVNGRKKVEEKFSLEKMALATCDVYREVLAQPRILVIKLSAVGDALLSIPSFEALKKKFPEASITALAGKGVEDVFQRCPYIDDMMIYDAKGKDRGWGGFWRLSRKIRRRRFDICLDLQNNRKSHLLSYLSMAPARYGYDNGKFSHLLNHRISLPREPLDPIAHQFRVLEMFGIPYSHPSLQVWPSRGDEDFARRFLDEKGCGGGRLIGINVGASPRWESKRWPAVHFARLCDRLAERKYHILLTGGSHDAVFARSVLAKTRTQPVCAVARTTLMQLAALISRCQVYVTSDSAPLHLAAAVGTPRVALFGPTNPSRHLPKVEGSEVLRTGCPPCYKGQCKLKRHRCMEEITVDCVLAAIDRLLERRP